MNLFLLTTDGAILGATIDVLFGLLVAFVLASLFWYFYQKKDKEEIEQLQKKLDKIQPQHDVLQNQHEHLKAAHLKIKQGLADLMDNYQTLNAQHESLVNNQTSTQNVYEQVDEERQSLLDSYESLESNFNALDAKYNDAVSTMDRLEEEIDNIKEERSELKLVNEHLRKELEKLEKLLAEKGEDIDAIRTELKLPSEAEEDELERLLGSAPSQNFVDTPVASEVHVTAPDNSEIEELKSAYEALKEDYNKLRNEHTRLNNDYQALQSTYNELLTSTGDSGENSEELVELRKAHLQLREKYTAVKKELESKVLPKLRATQTLLNQKEESYRQLSAKLATQTEKMQSSSSQLKAFEDIKATNQALYLGNKNLKEKNNDIEKQYETLSAKYTGLHSQFQLLREQFSIAEQKLEAQEEQDSTAELQQLSRAYSDLKIEYLAASDVHKAQKARVQELEGLLQAINESSSYGIIYLPSNLQTIEGIGPKLEVLLNNAGINNWNELAVAEVKQLKTILEEGGKRFAAFDPTSWPQQAQLLVTGQWRAFRDLEAELLAGKKKKSKKQEYDDLKVIEGIGPKIEVLLNNANIHTWKKLSKTGIGELKKILKAAGSKYQAHDPSSWPEQAALAATWNWTELEELQAELKGGRVGQ